MTVEDEESCFDNVPRAQPFEQGEASAMAEGVPFSTRLLIPACEFEIDTIAQVQTGNLGWDPEDL